MSTGSYKAIVRRYCEEVLDQESWIFLTNLAFDCVIHRADGNPEIELNSPSIKS